MKKKSRSQKNREEYIKEADRKLALYQRLLKGETKALIEIMIERGMAKREDFI